MRFNAGTLEREKTPYLLASIPVKVIMNPQVGLLGAAWCKNVIDYIDQFLYIITFVLSMLFATCYNVRLLNS